MGKKQKVIGYASKTDITKYLDGKLEPAVLEIWKDEKELRNCAFGKIQVIKVKVGS